jgi:hypothetical protein
MRKLEAMGAVIDTEADELAPDRLDDRTHVEAWLGRARANVPRRPVFPDAIPSDSGEAAQAPALRDRLGGACLEPRAGRRIA